MFENRLIKLVAPVKPDGTVSFVDSLRGFATAAFRIECNTLLPDPDSAAGAAANLVYNPGYEITVNPAVPDGNYVVSTQQFVGSIKRRNGFGSSNRREVVLTDCL